jgi:hypothetical protein
VACEPQYGDCEERKRCARAVALRCHVRLPDL